MDILVTYDVATLDRQGERRLARVAAICERFGVRVQYSVFECRLSPTAYQTFVGELQDVIKDAEDSVNLYRFDRPIPEVRAVLGQPKGRLGGTLIFGSTPRTSGDP